MGGNWEGAVWRCENDERLPEVKAGRRGEERDGKRMERVVDVQL